MLGLLVLNKKLVFNQFPMVHAKTNYALCKGVIKFDSSEHRSQESYQRIIKNHTSIWVTLLFQQVIFRKEFRFFNHVMFKASYHYLTKHDKSALAIAKIIAVDTK